MSLLLWFDYSLLFYTVLILLFGGNDVSSSAGSDSLFGESE